jgi:hypothetical protein
LTLSQRNWIASASHNKAFRPGTYVEAEQAWWENMPQIWMTYDELAALYGCTAPEARLQALNMSLDRRKSRDGNTRVKLNVALMARFIDTIRKSEFDLDDAVAALRDAHRAMSGGPAIEPASLRRSGA